MATFLAVVIGVVLLAGSAGLAMRDQRDERVGIDRALTSKVSDEAGQLEEYFARARTINLITAHNPAFGDFYAAPGSRLAKVKANGPAIRRAESALAYLERLYPASIGEACFIDRSGPENARYVRGVRATFANLSPDESRNPFFAPTVAVRAGEVFQAKPYVSPDTHEWVISNSTPPPGTGYPAAAIVHYEITLASFQRTAAAIAKHDEVAIVDAHSGKVVVDSRVPQRLGAPLGKPSDRRFTRLVGSQTIADTTRIGGHQAAYRRLRQTPHNANDWYVVAVDPRPAGTLLRSAGWAPSGWPSQRSRSFCSERSRFAAPAVPRGKASWCARPRRDGSRMSAATARPSASSRRSCRSPATRTRHMAFSNGTCSGRSPAARWSCSIGTTATTGSRQ